MLRPHPATFGWPGVVVFVSGEGKPIHWTNFRRRIWLPAVKAAGVEGLRFHDLRHTHASLLIAAGEHLKVIQERLGHGSIQVTLDTYGHLFDGMDRGTADRLDALIQRPDVADRVTGLGPNPLRTAGDPYNTRVSVRGR